MRADDGCARAHLRSTTPLPSLRLLSWCFFAVLRLVSVVPSLWALRGTSFFCPVVLLSAQWTCVRASMFVCMHGGERGGAGNVDASVV